MKKREKTKKEKTKQISENSENIYNIPNSISLARLVFSPILVFLVLSGAGIFAVITLFCVLALSDAFDGWFARKYNQVTKFGRKLDIIADRVLMISTILAVLLYASENSILTQSKIYLLVLIMSREIISIPFFITAFFISSRPIPHARTIGKLTTILQGFSFPIIILGWPVALTLSLLTCIIGIFSAGFYLYDSLINPNNKTQVQLDKHYKEN